MRCKYCTVSNAIAWLYSGRSSNVEWLSHAWSSSVEWQLWEQCCRIAVPLNVKCCEIIIPLRVQLYGFIILLVPLFIGWSDSWIAMTLPSLVSGWGEEVLPPGLHNVPCATRWVVCNSESMFFKDLLAPPVASVCNAPSITGHNTNASLFLAVLGKSIGPPCSTLYMLVFRPSKGNCRGTVPSDDSSCVARTSSPLLGMSISSTSLLRASGVLPCLVYFFTETENSWF